MGQNFEYLLVVLATAVTITTFSPSALGKSVGDNAVLGSNSTLSRSPIQPALSGCVKESGSEVYSDSPKITGAEGALICDLSTFTDKPQAACYLRLDTPYKLTVNYYPEVTLKSAIVTLKIVNSGIISELNRIEIKTEIPKDAPRALEMEFSLPKKDFETPAVTSFSLQWYVEAEEVTDKRTCTAYSVQPLNVETKVGQSCKYLDIPCDFPMSMCLPQNGTNQCSCMMGAFLVDGVCKMKLEQPCDSDVDCGDHTVCQISKDAFKTCSCQEGYKNSENLQVCEKGSGTALSTSLALVLLYQLAKFAVL